MKKLLITGAAVFATAVFSLFSAQDLQTMQKQRETLKYRLDLMDKQIELEKSIQERDKREATAQNLNSKADNKGGDFSEKSDAAKAQKDAKAAAKAMKKAESANKNLERSQNKIIDLEGDIRKLESKLNNSKYIVEIKEK